MTLQEELHRFVDTLDGSAAKEQLHTLVEDLNDKQVRAALTRMRGARYFLEKLGFRL